MRHRVCVVGLAVAAALAAATPSAAVTPEQAPLGSIGALGSRDGVQRWHVSPTKDRLYRVLFAADGVLFASSYAPCSDEGYASPNLDQVVAFDAATGRALWRSAPGLGADLWGGRGIVVVSALSESSSSVRVMGLDARSGRRLWSFEGAPVSALGSPDLLFSREVRASPGTQTFVFRARDQRTGKVRWTVRVESDTDVQLVGATASVVVLSDGQVLDARSGRRRYQLSALAGAYSILIAGSTIVYDTLGVPTVTGVDANTGKQRWQIPGAWTGATADGSGSVFLTLFEKGTSSGGPPVTTHLVAIDATTGVTRWSIPADAGFGEQLFAGHGIVVQPVGADLSVLDAATGQRLWTTAPPPYHTEVSVALTSKLAIMSGDAGSCGD